MADITLLQAQLAALREVGAVDAEFDDQGRLRRVVLGPPPPPAGGRRPSGDERASEGQDDDDDRFAAVGMRPLRRPGQ